VSQKPLHPVDTEFERLVNEANAELLSEAQTDIDADFSELQQIAVDDALRLEELDRQRRAAPTLAELSVVQPVVQLPADRAQFTQQERQTIDAAPPNAAPPPPRRDLFGRRIDREQPQPQDAPGGVLDRIGLRATYAFRNVNELMKRFHRGMISGARGGADFLTALADNPALRSAHGVPGVSAYGVGVVVKPFAQWFSEQMTNLLDNPNRNPLQTDPLFDRVANVDLFDDPRLALDPAWWAGNLSQGAGSMVPFALTSLSVGASPGAVGRAATLVDKIRRFAEASHGPLAGAAVEAATIAGDQFRDALESGMPPEAASQLAAKEYASQLALKAVTAVPGYALPKVLGTGRAATIGAGVVGEKFEEGGQQIITNINARAFDPERPWHRGVATGAAVGGVLGGVMGAGEFAVKQAADERRQALIEQLKAARRQTMQDWLATNATARGGFGRHIARDQEVQGAAREERDEQARIDRLRELPLPDATLINDILTKQLGRLGFTPEEIAAMPPEMQLEQLSILARERVPASAKALERQLGQLGYSSEQVAGMTEEQRLEALSVPVRREARQRSVNEFLAQNEKAREGFSRYEDRDFSIQVDVELQKERDARLQRLNPKLSLDTLRRLQQANVSSGVIGEMETEEDAAFVLASATRKPKAPVRPRRDFGSPGNERNPRGIADYLDADRRVQEGVRQEGAAEIATEPTSDLTTLSDEQLRDRVAALDLADELGMGDPTERARVDAEIARRAQKSETSTNAEAATGPVGDNGAPERGDADAGGTLGEGRLGGGASFRADDTETSEQHNERLFRHVLDDARRQDPGVSEDAIRQRFDAAREHVQELRTELDHARAEDGRNPDTLLQAIHEAGGLHDDELFQPMKGGTITTQRRQTGELRWIMEGSRFGRIGTRKQQDGTIGYQLVRRPDRGATAFRTRGLSWDQMRERLAQDHRFADVATDVNTLIDAVADAVRAVRWESERDTRDASKLALSDLQLGGIHPGERWWEPDAGTDAGTDAAVAPPDIDIDDALKALDDLLGDEGIDIDEPGARGMPLRPWESARGMAPRGMAAPAIRPEIIAATIDIFRRVSAAGMTDFEKAVNLLVQKQGREWVEGLSAVLPKAWEHVRKTNSKMGPASEVGAILAKGQANDRGTGKGAAPAGGAKPEGDSGSGGPGAPSSVDEREHGPGRAADSDLVSGGREDVPADISGVAPKQPSLNEQRTAARGSRHVAPYERRSEIRGTEHPKLIVETRSMSGAPYPDLTTEFTSPHALEAVKAGRVSVQQAEQALAAVQANLGTAGARGRRNLVRMVSTHGNTPMPAGYSFIVSSSGGAVVAQVTKGPTRDAEQEGRIVATKTFAGEQARQSIAIKWAQETARDIASGVVAGKPGHGYLIADAVGVGKSREIALAMLELMHRAQEEGRELRLIFTTLRHANIKDFLNELAYVASGRTLDGLDLASQDELSLGERVPGKIPFDVFKMADFKAGHQHKLPVKPRAIYVVDHQANLPRYIDQLLEMQPHGLVADEAHKLKNRGTNKWNAWQKAHAWIYSRTPRDQQTFIYATATPAQDATNYEYLYGLRLWPIDGFADWVSVVTGQADEKTANRIARFAETGTENAAALLDILNQNTTAQVGRTIDATLTQAEAEQIPREMKMLGRMSARDLWREGTEFRVHPGALTAAEQHRYRLFVGISTEVLDTLRKFRLGGAALRKNISGQLTLAAQRQQVDARLRKGIEVARRYVETGHQVVFSVMHVNEVDPTTHGNLHAAIRMIPETRMVNGVEVLIPGVREIKEQLFAKAAEFGKMAAPADVLKQAFGESDVAELVGAMTDAQVKSVREFQKGKRSVILISAAGSTGVNLQQRFLVEDRQGAKGRRVFIPVQHEWNAMNELQRYGRVDRADSVSPPIIAVVSFGTPIERRFFATIVARLRSMGALSTGGGSKLIDAMEDFDLTDETTHEAIRIAWSEAPKDLRALFPPTDDFKSEDGEPLDELPHGVGIEDVQEGLALLPVGRQDQFWNLLLKARETLINQRQDNTTDDAKTRRTRGRVLRQVPLGPMLNLYQLIDDNGHKVGLLQGVVMPHMPRLRPTLTDGQVSDRLRRVYMQFQTQGVEGKWGDVISGLVVPWMKVDRIARVFGRDISKWRLDTMTALENALLAGERIPLVASNERGARLALYRGQDGRTYVESATLRMRTRLEAAGAIYESQGNKWVVPDLLAFVRSIQPVDAEYAVYAQGWDDPPGPRFMGAARATKVKGHIYPNPKGLPVTQKPKRQMTPRQIRQMLEERLGLAIRTGRFRQKALGLYYLASRGARKKNYPHMIRTRIAEDLPVIAHEVGHHIADTVLGLNLRDSRWMQELLNVGITSSLPSYSIEQRVNEGAAEFMRHWMTDPSHAQALAPNFAVAFDEALSKHPEVYEVLKDAQQQILGFIELDYAERLRANISMRPDHVTPHNERRSVWEWIEFVFVDDLARLRRVVTGMAKAAGLDINALGIELNAHMQALLSRGWVRNAQSFLRHGVRDARNQFVARGLYTILKPLGERVDDFAVYLVARRAIELHERVREKRLGPLVVREKPINENAARYEWAQAAYAKHHSPEFEKLAREVYAYQDALLQYAVDNRVISQAQAALMRKWNQNYVPFYRVLDAWAESQGGAMTDRYANLSVPFKRIKGSGREIINPLESIVRNTYSIVNLVEHNKAALALWELAKQAKGSGAHIWQIAPVRVPVTFNMQQIEDDLREKLRSQGVDLPMGLDLKQMVTIWTPALFANGKQRLVTFLRDGKREFYEINDKPLFDALVAMSPHAWHPVLKVALVFPARALRWSVTTVPSFIIRNAVRDPWVAAFQSKHGFIPGLDHAYAIYHALGRTDLFQSYLTNGGGQAMIAGLSRENMERMLRRELKLKPSDVSVKIGDHVFSVPSKFVQAWDWITTPYDLLAYISEAIELAPRLAEHRLALQAGGVQQGVLGRLKGIGRAARVMGVKHALLHAGVEVKATDIDPALLRLGAMAGRDLTLNFQRYGWAGRYLNQITPFVNAQAQGWARMAETLNPTRPGAGGAWARVGMMSALTAILWFLNRDDERLRKVDAQRDRFWFLPDRDQDGGYIVLAKPHEYASFFANSVEAALDHLYEKDPEAVRRFFQNLAPSRSEVGLEGTLADLILQMLPVITVPVVEDVTNFQLYQRRPLSPPHQGDLGEFEWLDYDRWTTHSARALGRVMNWSPKRIENYVYRYTGAMGLGHLKGLDFAGEKLGLVPTTPDTGVSGWFHGSLFWQADRSTYTRSIRRLYEASDALQGASNATRRLSALQMFAERADALRENGELLARAPMITRAVRQLQHERANIDRVLNSNMDGEAMDEQLRVIAYRMDNIARAALGEPLVGPTEELTKSIAERKQQLPVTPR
jgi:hypothetical protein